MIILGIDPGSRTTGFAVIHSIGNQLKLAEGGAIRLEKEGEFSARLLCLGQRLDDILLHHRPDSLALEKVFHGLNVASTLKLGYIRGLVLYKAATHQVPVAEYDATVVKKAVTGYGRAEKHQVQEMVRVLLNLKETPKPHDVADAMAIAICHAHTAPSIARFHGNRRG